MKKVKVDVKLEHISGIDIIEEEYHGVFLFDDEIRVFYPCPNKACTGHGFTLNNEIRFMIKESKPNLIGCKYCTGKEDWKYRDKRTGNSCCTKMDYNISLILE